MSSDQVAISKLLSLMLRHRPGDFGLTLERDGWASVESVLGALSAEGWSVDRSRLAALVKASDKQRFALSEDGRRIRANQGHTVPVDLGHAPAEPPERLFHGTVARFLGSIRASGLLRGRRHHVHLSASVQQATLVGKRRGAPVVIEVRARQMASAGHVFLLTPNGVWLTDHVPPEFLIVPED